MAEPPELDVRERDKIVLVGCLFETVSVEVMSDFEDVFELLPL